ncbi:Hypothetical predicted protein, partial [Podarcis lilfordi]
GLQLLSSGTQCNPDIVELQIQFLMLDQQKFCPASIPELLDWLCFSPSLLIQDL